MTYNKNVEKVIVENAQIDNTEFKKAQAGEEFQIKFITKTGPKQPTLRELIIEMQGDIKNIFGILARNNLH